MANYQLDQTGAEVQAILDAVQNPDTSPASASTNLITSGGVYSAVGSVASDLTELGQRVDGLFLQVSEDGWFIVDSSNNIVLKYDTNGLDVAALSSHFLSLVVGFIQVSEDGFYFVDSSYNIGAYVDDDGIHAPNISGGNTLDYEIV